MREVLESGGVPKEAIIVETEARSTRENALNTKNVLDALPGRKVLLSSDFHMFRALRTFRKAGIEVVPRPIPDVIKRSGTLRGRWPAFLDEVEETAKIVYYWSRGWI